MNALPTMTVKDGPAIYWYGALCAVSTYAVDDLTALLKHGKTIGCINDNTARAFWHTVIKSPDMCEAIETAIIDLCYYFQALAAPGYKFRPHISPLGTFWGWWPAE